MVFLFPPFFGLTSRPHYYNYCKQGRVFSCKNMEKRLNFALLNTEPNVRPLKNFTHTKLYYWL